MNSKPLTKDTWNDFELLFGEKGACAGCWCMYWRLKNADFEKGKGSVNRNAMKEIVDAGEIPGLLAYDNDQPVGWVALAQRDRYLRLAGSRIFSPPDDKPVCSITCFFIDKRHRKQGVSRFLINESIVFARKHGHKILEAYPHDHSGEQKIAPFVWTGITSAFMSSGFKEVVRRSAHRPLMRYYL